MNHATLSVPPCFSNAAFDVVAFAASAGGLPALREVLAGLPASFPAAITIVQHLAPNYRSKIAHVLERHTVLSVKQAEEGDRLSSGWVYIAPPDHHLLVNPDGTLSLSQSEQVHFLRPSADRLFESMAASYGDRSIAVVLSGTGQDGAIGVQAVKRLGGIVIAQDQHTSEFFGMPSAAIHTGAVDFILPLPEISFKLARLVMAQ